MCFGGGGGGGGGGGYLGPFHLFRVFSWVEFLKLPLSVLGTACFLWVDGFPYAPLVEIVMWGSARQLSQTINY